MSPRPSQLDCPWTPTQVTDLTRLWHEGVPTAEIARRLGLTKNQVIGKVNRLHLAARANPVVRKPPLVAGTHEPPPCPPGCSPELHERLLKIERTHGFGGCSWIIGESGAHAHACRMRTQPGEPYCSAHAARVPSRTYTAEQRAAWWAADDGLRQQLLQLQRSRAVAG